MDHSFGGSLLFNGFDLDLKAPELRFEGKPVPMQLQPLKVLSFLASRPREVVSRASLRQHLWQQDTFVDFEAGLNFCIRQIRRTLGDNARRPHLVETLRRRGYRFIGSVARCEHGQPQQNSGQRKITVTVSPSGTERDDHAVAQITERIAQFLVSSYGNGHDPSPAAPMLRQDATIRHGGGDPAGWAVKRGP
ncbi:MAG: winged helix-turn-helix domain-containing protein, partial [Terracidiphilus sp.]